MTIGLSSSPAAISARSISILPRPRLRAFTTLIGVILTGTALIACSDKEKNKPTPPPPEVGIVQIQTEAVALTSELAGRTVAYEASEVRPQITGIVLRRRFTEGAAVRQGEVLYEIAPQMYRAAVEQATANLASTEATLVAAKERAARFTKLVEIDAVSRQDQADAVATAAQAQAAVQQSKAALSAARINLGFTSITAPISGRIGRSLVTTGALVTAGQQQPLTTIQRLDPIFVDIQQSSARLLELRRALSKGGLTATSTPVRLTLEDGSMYPRTGTLEFAEVSVDPSTGSVTLRARFPNPNGLLLPGMYVRATVGEGDVPTAILAPQQGVIRDPRGRATAFVVVGDSIETRNLTLDRTVGDHWLVSEGLKPGDRLVVEGTSRIKPGQKVRTVPGNIGSQQDSVTDSVSAKPQTQSRSR